MDQVLLVIATVLGGVNLGFVLKIIYNDLKHIDDKLDAHINSHLERAEALADRRRPKRLKRSRNA